MNEIDRAYKAHANVDERLKSTKPLLRTPSTEILHTICESEINGNYTKLDDQGWRMVFIHRYFTSRKSLASQIPPPDDMEMEFRKRWYEGGDHALLMEIMASGRIPLAWNESMSPARARTIGDAYEIARNRGYNVPAKFIHSQSNTSYSEAEAWMASNELVRGNFMAWTREIGKHKKGSKVRRRNKICLAISSLPTYRSIHRP